jgi:hypothetical protein
MLCGTVFLLVVGAGTFSLDARMNRAESASGVTSALV